MQSRRRPSHKTNKRGDQQQASPALGSTRSSTRMHARLCEDDELDGGLHSQRSQKSGEEADQHDDLHRVPRGTLNMFAIINIAADVKLDDRAKPSFRADHGAALMV